MKMNGLTQKENVRQFFVIVSNHYSFSVSSAKKLKKEKLGAFSSPGRGKSGRGPGRPPKHPRVEEATPTPTPSDVLTLKVSSLDLFALYYKLMRYVHVIAGYAHYPKYSTSYSNIT